MHIILQIEKKDVGGGLKVLWNLLFSPYNYWYTITLFSSIYIHNNYYTCSTCIITRVDTNISIPLSVDSESPKEKLMPAVAVGGCMPPPMDNCRCPNKENFFLYSYDSIIRNSF